MVFFGVSNCEWFMIFLVMISYQFFAFSRVVTCKGNSQYLCIWKYLDYFFLSGNYTFLVLQFRYCSRFIVSIVLFKFIRDIFGWSIKQCDKFMLGFFLAFLKTLCLIALLCWKTLNFIDILVLSIIFFFFNLPKDLMHSVKRPTTNLFLVDI